MAPRRESDRAIVGATTFRATKNRAAQSRTPRRHSRGRTSCSTPRPSTAFRRLRRPRPVPYDQTSTTASCRAENPAPSFPLCAGPLGPSLHPSQTRRSESHAPSSLYKGASRRSQGRSSRVGALLQAILSRTAQEIDALPFTSLAALANVNANRALSGAIFETNGTVRDGTRLGIHPGAQAGLCRLARRAARPFQPLPQAALHRNPRF